MERVATPSRLSLPRLSLHQAVTPPGHDARLDFACADALVEKRVGSGRREHNPVRYDLARSSAGPAEIEVKALVNYRDFHSTTQAANFNHNGSMKLRSTAAPSLRVVARAEAVPFYLLSDVAAAEPRHEWYLNFDLAQERLRGLDDREDHLLAGIFRAPGDR